MGNSGKGNPKIGSDDDTEQSKNLDSLRPGQIQMLKEKFDNCGGNELSLRDFKKIMPFITKLPPKIIERAFAQFANQRTHKITYENLCSAVSKYMLSSRDNKCEFIYKVFNTSNTGELNKSEAQLLNTYLLNVPCYIKHTESLLSLFSEKSVSYDKFRIWAYNNIDLHEAIRLFEIIPSPKSEKEFFLKNMQDFRSSGLKNSEYYYLISFSWLETWSKYVVLEIEISSSNLVSYKSGRRPDRISNSELLDNECTEKLIPGLKENTNFIVLPKSVWQDFVKWYGGGPKILRQAVRINDVIEIEFYPPLFKIYYQKSLKSGISEKPLQTFISITESVQSVLYAVKSYIYEDEELGVYIKNDDRFRLVDKNTRIGDLELKDINLCVVVFMSNSEGREISIEINEDDLDFVEGDNVEYKSMGQWVLAKVKRVNGENFVLENRERGIVNVSRSEIGRLRKPKLEMLVNKKDYLFCGIRNVAKSCSISAVLQVLFHTPFLREHFSNEKFCKSAQGLKSSYSQEIFEFGKMFNDVKDTKKTLIDPTNFIRAFKEANNGFLCDAYEFLQTFLNHLHKALCNSEFELNFPRQVTFENPEVEINANSQWQEYIGQESSIISRVFGFQKKTSKTCRDCPSYRSTFEVSNDISIPIPISRKQKILLTIVPRNCSYLKRITITVNENMTLENFIMQVDNKSPVRYKNLIFSHIANSDCGNCFFPTSMKELRPILGFELYGFEIIILINDAENLGTFIAKHKTNLNWRNNLQVNELVDYNYNGRWELAHIKRLNEVNVEIVIHVKEGKEECIGRSSPNLEFYRTKTVSSNEILVVPITQYNKNNEDISPFSTPCVLSIGCWYTWYDLNNELKRICWQFYDRSKKDEFTAFFYLHNRENGKCEVCRSDCRGCRIPNSYETLESLSENYRNLYIKIVWKSSNSYKPLRTEALPGDEISSLHECLSNFVQPTLLEMNCKICLSPMHSIKSELWEIPEILILHLNRIECNLTGTVTRINTLVKFPLKNLDIRKMMISKIANTGQTVNNIESNYLYDLYAVIDHRGNVRSGHYTAYCMTKNGEWLHFDDEKVNLINKDFDEEIVTSKAYILFYKRNRFRSENIVRHNTMS